MALNEYLREFRAALEDEIAAARKQGGRKVALTEGRYLGSRHNYYLYSFTTDTELKFPDDTPVDLEVKGHKTRGLILSVHQFDLILGLMEHLGDDVASARLSTEPWFLLEELIKRLESISGGTNGNRALLNMLLSSNAKAQAPDTQAVQRLLAGVARETGRKTPVNSHQLKAIGHVLANPISFIWGPPGTGKTLTLGATVAALVAEGKSVLVLSHSNVAVDVAMLGIARIMEGSHAYREHRILRLGVFYREELNQYPELHIRGAVCRHNPDLVRELETLEEEQRRLTKQSREEDLTGIQRAQLKRELERIRDNIDPLQEELQRIEREFAGEAQVIGCTLSKASIDETIFRRAYDAVLIDEASMVYIPHCAFASSLAQERVAVFGDFRQLPPISQAESLLAEKWLQRDIFEHVGIVDKVNRRQADPRLVLLATQYRMHPQIAAIPNKLFYDWALKDGPDVRQETSPITEVCPVPGSALVLCDLSFLGGNCYFTPRAMGFSRFNLVSALVAVNVAHRILATSPYSVGIVTPYNAQARLIRNLLSDLDARRWGHVTVDTVHRFQGSEQEVVLFDMVEAANCRKPGILLEGGLGSTAMRLANVAISRAKGKFVLLVDLRHVRDHFEPRDCLRQFVQEIEAQGRILEIKWPSANQRGIWSDSLSQISIDPRMTKANVPGRVGLISAQDAAPRKVGGLDIIHIDENRLWLRVTAARSSGPVIQLNTPRTIQLLHEFWELGATPSHVQAGKSQIAQDQVVEREGPVGKLCPECRNPLTPAVSRKGIPYLKCTNRFCDHTEAMTKEDVTYLAEHLGLKCEKCGGQAVGQKGKTVFIGCRRYPRCNWQLSILDLLKHRPI